MDGPGFFLGSTPFYPGYFFDQQQQQQQLQQQFGPFMNELHSQLNVGEGSQSRPGSASSDTTSSPTSPVAVASTSSASSPESGPAKKTYDKWPEDDQKMLIRLWADNFDRLESRESDNLKKKNCNSEANADDLIWVHVYGRFAGNMKSDRLIRLLYHK